jgi:hypothetical protein
VLVHYIDTFAAIDRMRAKLHRGDSLEEAEARQDESDSKFFEAAERG